MRRNSCLAVLLALAVCVAGCGSSEEPSKAPEPKGALSKQEHRLMLRSARRLEHAKKSHDSHASVRSIRAACRTLRNPQTALLQGIYSDCLSGLAFVRALVGLDDHGHACGTQERRGNLQCASRLLRPLARTARDAILSAKATNRIVRARRIRGRCRKFVETSVKELRALSRIGRRATALNDAIQTLESRQINLAGERFVAALPSWHGSGGDPVRQVRACR